MLSNCNSCFGQTFIHVCKKCFSPLWPHPTPGDYDSNKFESSLHVKYSLQIPVFLTKLFQRIIYINIYLLYFYFRFLYILFVILSPHDHSTSVWSSVTHRNHGLNFVSTLHEYGPVGFREDENMKSLRRQRRLSCMNFPGSPYRLQFLFIKSRFFNCLKCVMHAV